MLSINWTCETWQHFIKNGLDAVDVLEALLVRTNDIYHSRVCKGPVIHINTWPERGENCTA